MKVAVTGATGFVGRHVLEALRARNTEVVAVSRPRSDGLLAGSDIDIVTMDIAECGTDAFERIGAPDVLVHLAWDGLPNYKSVAHVDMQLPVQRRFLQACIASGLKHLVVSGTCLEYGMQSGELHEDMPNSPSTSYGNAKDMLRRELQDLQSTRPFDLTWLRLFYLYGPGQASSSLYSKLKTAIENGDPTFDMSPGDQVRDFLPIQEAARHMVDLALRPRNNGVVNICSGNPVAIADLVRGWLNNWNASIELATGILPYPDYEPFAFWGSRAKLDGLGMRL